MPRLPTVETYGARPSLRSTRVDLPGNADVIMGDALANAANTFAQMAVEKKQKDDRLQYALAKDDLLEADMASREELKDRTDYDEFDNSYSTNFNTRRDEILGKYKLTSSDRALLASESDLIRERGRVKIGDTARTMRIDDERAQLQSNVDRALEEIMLEDSPDLANQRLLSVLEQVDASVERGNHTEVEGEKIRQNVVQAAAVGSLDTMGAKERLEELELSMAHRRARGPITAEDIAAGKGSGSIADFLHADMVTEMIEQSKKQNAMEDEIGQAYEIVDAARAIYQTDSKGLMSEIRKLSQGKPAKVRQRAEAMGRQVAEERRIAKNEERDTILNRFGEILRETDETGNFVHTLESLPAEEMAKLTPGQVTQIERYFKLLRNGRQFGAYTNWHDEQVEDGTIVKPSYSTWTRMTDAEKAAVDLSHPMWHTNLEQAVWKQMADEQESIRDGKGPAANKVQTNDQILMDVMVGEVGFPRTGRSDAEDMQYQMMRSRVADEIARVQEAEFGGAEAPFERRKEIVRQVVSEQVWKRDAGMFGWLHRMDASLDEAVPVATVHPDEYDEYFVPIDLVESATTRMAVGEPRGPNGTYLEEQYIEANWADRLKAIAQSELDGRVPEQKDIENAYAQIIIGGNPDEVAQRVIKALAGEHEH